MNERFVARSGTPLQLDGIRLVGTYNADGSNPSPPTTTEAGSEDPASVASCLPVPAL